MNPDTTTTPKTDSIISAIDMDAAFQDLCREREARQKADGKNELLIELCEMALYYYEHDEIRSQIRKQLDLLNHNPNNKPS